MSQTKVTDFSHKGMILTASMYIPLIEDKDQNLYLNGAPEHPTNRRYPLDTYSPKYQELHGTLRDQDQVIWEDQEVLTRSRPPARPSLLARPR